MFGGVARAKEVAVAGAERGDVSRARMQLSGRRRVGIKGQ
jgi:hypothetical protein